ncbi:hypothetical protein BDV96DRAFT_576661 [Lophiotrema nucula]|uniref:DNA replication factor Cdt1 C-terminal domain-containing protein n=1 Tax=Lophiotrema nucula TaxID=690887 RepID=A0A6A5Z4E2_9PLEO|nr:hypothetical protein BDV96DRAFT_576661 [Lophiotrema nucula]
MPSAIASRTLPTELVNLLALHSAFLTALQLHYAHNGTSTPVDLRQLNSSVTSVWGQRKVTIDDIRLCIGVLSSGPSGNKNPFYLSDYSRGKICLEIRDEHKLSGALDSMNAEAIQAMFMDSLDYLWKAWSASHGPQQKLAARPIATPKRRGRPRRVDAKQTSIQLFVDETTLPKFIAQLPHAEIALCSSVAGVAPLQEKGRKRLRDIKESVQQGRSQKKIRGTTGKENEPVLSQNQPAQAKITEFAAVRKSNLLDRILAKQEAAKLLPNPPTQAELERKAALQRSEDVLGVMSLLAASKGGMRVSLSMTTLLQSLQASMRTPLSKDEAMRVVEVLASEVTPGYVSVLKMGALSSVVINQTMRPMDVKGRLAALGA